MSTQLIDFSPVTDLVFAVSQENLNQGLAEYITSLGSQVTWQYDYDAKGHVHPCADKTKPDISFTGTLAPPIQPLTGGPNWIVDLSGAGPANQVTFNVTFEDGATFVNHKGGITYTQRTNSGGTLWVIPYQVDLIKAALPDASKASLEVAQQLSSLNTDYGDCFDLSHILLDLETLAMTVDPSSIVPDDWSIWDWTFFINGMTQDLKDNHGQIYTTPPTAGYAITQNDNVPTKSTPTFTPTDYAFVIIPDKANNGGSSCLVFAMVIDNHKLPLTPADSFTNVTLIADPIVTPGVALINTANTIKFTQNDFATSGIGNAISQFVESDWDGNNISWKLCANSDGAGSQALTPAADNNQAFIKFRMNEKQSSTDHTFFDGGSVSGTAWTDSSATALFSDQKPTLGYQAISLQGTMTMQISNSTTERGDTDGWESPHFDWNWSAYYAIEPVNASGSQTGGGVQLVLKDDESSFPSAPVDRGDSQGSWFNQTPSTKSIVQNQLAPAIAALPSTFESKIDTLETLGYFVFPGGGTFTFQSPAVNNVLALYSIIQYQNPS